VSLKTLAQLLEMVAGLQRDLGLEDALPLERDILAVFGALSREGQSDVRTESLMEHPLLADVPKASFHRALRSLLKRGLIQHADGYKTGRYRLSPHF
jgi:predicted transcriptional regulator